MKIILNSNFSDHIKVLLEHNTACSFDYVFSKATFTIVELVVVMETIWLPVSKIFTILPFTEKFTEPGYKLDNTTNKFDLTDIKRTL